MYLYHEFKRMSKFSKYSVLGAELESLLWVREGLISGCEKIRLILIKIKNVLVFLKITIISLSTKTTSIQAIYLAFNIAC